MLITVVRMFRASLRSVADPVQHHVCLSCQARRFDAPTRLRQFHAQSALWTELANGQLEAHPGETTSHPREAAKSGSGGNLPNEVRCLRFAQIPVQLQNGTYLQIFCSEHSGKWGIPVEYISWRRKSSCSVCQTCELQECRQEGEESSSESSGERSQERFENNKHVRRSETAKSQGCEEVFGKDEEKSWTRIGEQVR